MKNKVIIALGSNIDPEYHVPYSLKAIDDKFNILDMSEFIYTEPLLYKDQDEFLNGSVLIETAFTQNEVNEVLKSIEDEMDRERSENVNGPRKIDLDIIVFNHNITDEDVYERDFLQRAINQLLPGLRVGEKSNDK